MKLLKNTIGLVLLIILIRLIPHSPNFTPIISLVFYFPILLGNKCIPFLLLGFILSDLFIGIHHMIFFTWGSILVASFMSRNFKKNTFTRISGSLSAAIIFFVVTNFGVWSLGFYSYTIQGLVLCFYLAIPFFSNMIISTLIYSSLIEILYFNKKIKKIISFKHSI